MLLGDHETINRQCLDEGGYITEGLIQRNMGAFPPDRHEVGSFDPLHIPTVMAAGPTDLTMTQSLKL